MKWDLLCDNCRAPKLTVAALAELPRGAHCPSCNIDYDRDFERNVELSFSPAPAIRPLMAGGYCLSGPMATPHVPVQVLLQPGERRSVDLVLPPGRYRLRTLHPGTTADVEHDGGAFPGLRATATGVEALPPGEPGKIAFVNDAGFELAALVEDRTWTKRGADRARGGVAAGLPRPVRRGDAAAGRRGGGRPGGAAVHRPARLDRALRAGRRRRGLQHRARALRLPGLDRARPRRRGGEDDRRCGDGLVRRSGRRGEGGARHAGAHRGVQSRARCGASWCSRSASMSAPASW